MKHSIPLLLVALLAGCAPQHEVPEVDLSPAGWPAEDLARYWELQVRTGTSGPLATGQAGIIAGTSSALAIHAGHEALRQGGSAADAVMTAALAQVTLHMGGATSFAGQIGMLYFDAETGQVHNMNGGYATLLEEDDPMSIPPYGTPSGRAVLVPGFMAGVEAASERFGKLPFAKLFEPAIYLAETGFAIPPRWARYLEQREHVVTRLPEGRALFTKENGELYEAGDHFTQPALAETLRRVVSEGATYMYEGEWGQKLVEAVREEGSKMTLADLEQYEVEWREPRHTTFRDYEIYGSAGLIEAFNLLELADFRSQGHFTESAESLYWLAKILRVSDVLGPQLVGGSTPAEVVRRFFPELNPDMSARVSKDAAAQLWAAMHDPRWGELEAVAHEIHLESAEVIANLIRDFRLRPRTPARPNHTAGVVAVDAEGNMAAIVHSVTSAVWGELGVFVDGVSVVDPGAFAQDAIAKVGPGNHLGSRDGVSGCPVLVVRDGRPVLGCGSVGAGYYDATVQAVLSVLEFGMDPRTAAEQPQFRKNWPPNVPLRQPIGEGQFTRAILEAVRDMGIDLEIVTELAQASPGGSWVAVVGNPETGKLWGGLTKGGNGWAEGH